MTVNIKSTFKKDSKEFNGLDDEVIRKGLVEEPLARRYIVAMVETSKVTTDVEGGGIIIPTVRLVSVEVCDGDDAIVVKEILDGRFKRRTGRTVEPTLFDQDDADANADAQHVGDILAGQIPFLAPPDAEPAAGVPFEDGTEVTPDGPPVDGEPPAGDDKPKRGRK